MVKELEKLKDKEVLDERSATALKIVAANKVIAACSLTRCWTLLGSEWIHQFHLNANATIPKNVYTT